MKILATNRRVLTWLCLLPADENASRREKFGYAIFGSVIFTLNVFSVPASGMYFLEHATVSLEKALYALIQILATSNIIYLMICAFLQRRKTAAFIEKLSEIYDEHSSNESFHFLVEANDRSEWIWNFYLKYLVFCFPAVIVGSAGVSTLFSWMTYGQIDIELLSHTIRLRLPWNQKTLLGYAAEILYSSSTGLAFAIALPSTTLLFISICWHHQAFSEMYRHSALKLNQLDKGRDNKKHISQLIEFHISVKNWFYETSDVFSPIVAFQLINSMLFVACGIFQMDLLFKQINLDVLVIFFGILAGIITLFVYCYFGKIATESFAKMADHSYEVNWYELPTNLQKNFILLIVNTQEPLYYHGFHVATLNLETFCKLMNTAFSYYMVFKTLTE